MTSYASNLLPTDRVLVRAPTLFILLAGKERQNLVGYDPRILNVLT